MEGDGRHSNSSPRRELGNGRCEQLHLGPSIFLPVFLSTCPFGCCWYSYPVHLLVWALSVSPCLLTCLSAFFFLPPCLLTCLPSFLSACLVCLSTALPLCLSTRLSVHLFSCHPACFLVCLTACLLSCLLICLVCLSISVCILVCFTSCLSAFPSSFVSFFRSFLTEPSHVCLASSLFAFLLHLSKCFLALLSASRHGCNFTTRADCMPPTSLLTWSTCLPASLLLQPSR